MYAPDVIRQETDLLTAMGDHDNGGSGLGRQISARRKQIKCIFCQGTKSIWDFAFLNGHLRAGS